MFRMPIIALLVVATGCPGGGGSLPEDMPDAAAVTPDANKPPVPDPPLRGYGQACTDGSQCAGGLCIGETGATHVCSIPCNIDIANDCRAVDAFCVPIGDGDHACYGTIDTGNDLDDAILSIGDSATRSLTPLGDTDLFQVRLNQLGEIRFTVTPNASIDVKLEAYGMIGSPLAVANNTAAGEPEVLETSVQQIGGHAFLAVRNVGQSTGGYTLNVTKLTALTAAPAEAPLVIRPSALTAR